MTRTEDLIKVLEAKLSYGHTPHTSRLVIEILLQACKEAGLKFVSQQKIGRDDYLFTADDYAQWERAHPPIVAEIELT